MSESIRVWGVPFTPVTRGEAADLVHAIRPAADILTGMVEQAAALLRCGPDLLR